MRIKAKLEEMATKKKKKMVHPFPPVKHRKYQHNFEEE